ncbi:MAG TPA: hypothetical protein ACFYD0_05300 [Candidatus Wunengus sp. YC65]|uniref:hypothetical protein n=1 Tax=Candidatus Wunengus sp. YC65 TaxID=3367701 RepID=UPI0040294A10
MGKETNNKKSNNKNVIEGYKLAYSSLISLKGFINNIFTWLIPGILASIALSIKDGDINAFIDEKLPFLLYTIIFVTTIVSIYDYYSTRKEFALIKIVKELESALKIPNTLSIQELDKKFWSRICWSNIFFYQGLFCLGPFIYLLCVFLKKQNHHLSGLIFIILACFIFPSVRLYHEACPPLGIDGILKKKNNNASNKTSDSRKCGNFFSKILFKKISLLGWILLSFAIILVLFACWRYKSAPSSSNSHQSIRSSVWMT